MTDKKLRHTISDTAFHVRDELRNKGGLYSRSLPRGTNRTVLVAQGAFDGPPSFGFRLSLSRWLIVLPARPCRRLLEAVHGSHIPRLVNCNRFRKIAP